MMFYWRNLLVTSGKFDQWSEDGWLSFSRSPFPLPLPLPRCLAPALSCGHLSSVSALGEAAEAGQGPGHLFHFHRCGEPGHLFREPSSFQPVTLSRLESDEVHWVEWWVDTILFSANLYFSWDFIQRECVWLCVGVYYLSTASNLVLCKFLHSMKCEHEYIIVGGTRGCVGWERGETFQLNIVILCTQNK